MLQMDATASLAQSITWSSSKQTYYTARLMVDKELVHDCYRAYAYFRWADDVIDASTPDDALASDDVSSPSRDERISFIKQQRELIDRLYKNEQPEDLTPEEEIIVDLVNNARGESGRLESYIRNFLAILEFDALRKGQLISQDELTWYVDRLSKSVTDGIQYFVGNAHPYPTSEDHYLAATAAHIAHMLRDMVQDIPAGFINIPREYLEAHGIGPADLDSPPFRAWVRDRVAQARRYFCEGKRYLDRLDVLRCKIVAYWYCARFEGVLDAIERDGYVLRAEYNERRKLSNWLKMARLAVSIALRHAAHRLLGKVADNRTVTPAKQ